MGLLGNIFGRRKRRRARNTLMGPQVTLGQTPMPRGERHQELMALREATEPGTIKMPPNSSGYILITDVDDHETSYLGRVLDFDVNRGKARQFLGKNRRGDTEKVLLDGHVIYETQIRNASTTKLQRLFMEEFDIQMLTASQVAGILADEEDDPQMYGSTAAMDDAMEDYVEAELDSLRAELEEDYLERFEEDYQTRFKQEYPGKFSSDYQDHYNDMVKDELDDVVDDHEELYHEYIVTPKHIRYKR